MEKIHFDIFQFQIIIIPLFLSQFFSLLLASTNYEASVKYFINCGSKSIVIDSGRNFVGDKKHSSNFSPGRSEATEDKNPSANTSLLYQTARIYRNPSPYELDIPENGTYFVRLHFFAFDSEKINLADALFNVSTSKFWLLSNFAIQNASSSAVVKEFLLSINVSKFSIYFIPHGSSFAFINAIEVFLASPKITKDASPTDAIEVFLASPIITKDASPTGGEKVSPHGFLSDALHTVHRINVGGPVYNDSLWRNWIPDNDYLHQNGLAKDCGHFDGKLIYDLIEKDIYAPDIVYTTCKVSDIKDAKGLSFSNTTWRFNVSINARHLVRVHFCDIVSMSKNTVKFKLIIGSKLSYYVNPIDSLDSPIYFDFVIDSDGLGFLEIGIRPLEETLSLDGKAFLNGVEIMELMKETEFNPPSDKPKHHQHIIVGSVGGLAFVVFLVGVVFLGLKYRKRKQFGIGPVVLCGGWIFCSGKTSMTTSISSLLNCNLKLRMPLADILNATRNFDPELLIGEGGFGKVYKGKLRSGVTVAVKRSNTKHGQGLLEFQTEVMILSKIRHRHLVSLIGYCQEGSEMILVYEFMEMGTLRDHLYDSGNHESSSIPAESKLSWKQRLEICIGSAKGLHYLHTGSDGGIIHRDVKSTNILLDEHYLAKVADFGLSRSGPLDPDHYSIGIKGSFGYLDPEYLTCLQFTEKSDVYSFGVVLLEVLCARPAIMNSTRMEEVNLVDWAMYWLKKDQIETIIDPFLVGQVNANSLKKFVEIAEKCLKRNGEERPTMYDVLWYLEYALQLQKPEVPGEPNESTTTDVFLDSTVVRRFPSFSITDYEDDDHVLIGETGSSNYQS